MCIDTVTNTNIQFSRSSCCTCSIAQSCASSVIRSLVTLIYSNVVVIPRLKHALIRYYVRVGTRYRYYYYKLLQEVLTHSHEYAIPTVCSDCTCSYCT